MSSTRRPIAGSELITKLLALANDPVASKAERDAAWAKTQELMMKMLAGRPVPC